MAKRINIIFFGLCFIAALIGEAYCIIILKGDLFSTVCIGFVVLITGYLFMDSIRSKLIQSRESGKFYMDHILQEENDRWNEKYNELVNLQKATYTATKKNTAMLEQQFDKIQTRQEAIANNIVRELQMVIDLQKKAMEGQKNALNLEINYNKENTKQLMQVLREESEKASFQEQLSKILELLEDNHELMKELKNLPINSEINENAPELSWHLNEEPEPEAVEFLEEEELVAATPKVVPLYTDPNKNLTADEIAELFASAGQ